MKRGKNLHGNERCCTQTARKADQVWLGQAEVAARQWGLELELQQEVEVEELQPQLLQLGRAQLWQRQLRSQTREEPMTFASVLSHLGFS